MADLVQKKEDIDRKEAIIRQREIEKEQKNLIRDEPIIRKTKVGKRAKKEGKKILLQRKRANITKVIKGII